MHRLLGLIAGPLVADDTIHVLNDRVIQNGVFVGRRGD
jgi:hypothetical protein